MIQSPDLKKRKLYSTLCHVSTFLSWFILLLIIPIVILCISDDEIVQENANEAINFYISFIIYYVIALILCFGLPLLLLIGANYVLPSFATASFAFIGIPLLVLLIVADYMLPFLAIIHCLTHLNRAYRYPFIWRFV